MNSAPQVSLENPELSPLPQLSEGILHGLKTQVGAAIPDRMYFRIRDVSEIVGVKPYVLRFWENEFSILSPGKSETGHRVYRKSDVETLLLIKRLLHVERYSIEGARKRINELRKEGDLKVAKKEVAGTGGVALQSAALKELSSAARELQSLLQTPIRDLFKY